MPDKHTEPTAGTGWIGLLRDGRGRYTVLLNVGVVLHAINILAASTIMPSVVAEIGEISFYAWPAMLYMVGTIAGAACGEPALGALHQRGAYVAAGIIFGIGAAISALAPTMPVLIAGQLVQGFGGGLLTALSMALVHVFYEGPLRVRILSVISTTWSVAAVIGPLVGGIFANMGWWRGTFWFSVAAVAVFCVVSWRAIPATRRETRALHWPLLRLGLLTLGVLCVGITGQITTATAIAALLAVAVALVWMTFRLDSSAERRLFPTGALSAFTPVGAAYLAAFMLSASHMLALVYMPLVLKVVYGVSPLWVGYFSTVFSVAWTIGALAVAGWEDGRARAAMFWGLVLMAGSIGGFAAGVGTAPMWVLLIWISLFGLGIGAANVHLIAWTMSAALPGEESVTASSMQAVRSLGIAFGSGAASLIVNSAGLGGGDVASEVAAAIRWLYSFDIIPPALGALFVLRMLQLGRRRAAMAR